MGLMRDVVVGGPVTLGGGDLRLVRDAVEEAGA
jgi:hypothetical protein